jgi:hypothetical protein
MTAESAEAGDFCDSDVTPVANGPDQEPYVHDSSSAAGTARLVDKAYESAKRWWDVADSLRAEYAAAGADPESPLVRELILAISYTLQVEHGGKPGCELRPRTPPDGEYAWPPRISEVTPDVVALWRDVADLAEHPAAQARFADLLFERRAGVLRNRAAVAVDAYRVRAWESLADVCSELAVQAGAAMARTPPIGPGVALPMIAALAAKPARGQAKQAPDTVQDRAAVIALLDTAFRTYHDGHNASQVASMMRAQTDDPTEIDAINRREVSAYMAEAAVSAGMAKQRPLQEAIKIARDRGLTDLAREATAACRRSRSKNWGSRSQFPLSASARSH